MARDHFHSAVRNALIKDGWTITDDPLRVSYGLSNMEIDLGAENLVAAQKDLQKIAVEIKSFLGSSALSEFHVALGQCLNYRLARQLVGSDRRLFLAVPHEAYETFFSQTFAQASLNRNKLSLLIYNPYDETVVQWIMQPDTETS